MSERAFKTEKDFKNKTLEYIEYCREYKQMPNVAGFCVYCDITRETFYAQENYYSDTYKKVQDILENAVINTDNSSDTMKIFYMKNKFGYKDKQDIDANVNTEIRVELND